MILIHFAQSITNPFLSTELNWVWEGIYCGKIIWTIFFFNNLISSLNKVLNLRLNQGLNEMCDKNAPVVWFWLSLRNRNSEIVRQSEKRKNRSAYFAPWFNSMGESAKACLYLLSWCNSKASWRPTIRIFVFAFSAFFSAFVIIFVFEFVFAHL